MSFADTVFTIIFIRRFNAFSDRIELYKIQDIGVPMLRQSLVCVAVENKQRCVIATCVYGLVTVYR